MKSVLKELRFNCRTKDRYMKTFSCQNRNKRSFIFKKNTWSNWDKCILNGQKDFIFKTILPELYL